MENDIYCYILVLLTPYAHGGTLELCRLEEETFSLLLIDSKVLTLCLQHEDADTHNEVVQ